MLELECDSTEEIKNTDVYRQMLDAVNNQIPRKRVRYKSKYELD